MLVMRRPNGKAKRETQNHDPLRSRMFFHRKHLDGCFSKLKTQHPLTRGGLSVNLRRIEFPVPRRCQRPICKVRARSPRNELCIGDVAGCIHRNVDHDFKTSLDRVLCVPRNVRHDLMQNTAPRSSRWRGLAFPANGAGDCSAGMSWRLSRANFRRRHGRLMRDEFAAHPHHEDERRGRMGTAIQRLERDSLCASPLLPH